MLVKFCVEFMLIFSSFAVTTFGLLSVLNTETTLFSSRENTLANKQEKSLCWSVIRSGQIDLCACLQTKSSAGGKKYCLPTESTRTVH